MNEKDAPSFNPEDEKVLGITQAEDGTYTIVTEKDGTRWVYTGCTITTMKTETDDDGTVLKVEKVS